MKDLLSLWLKFYEGCKVYKINPCDVDSFPKLQPLGKFFALFCYGTDCRCCLGFRTLAALLFGIALGACL